ncbi:hypothetical protein G6047_06655 [Flavobacterium sp. SE-s28]|uniref:Uncharacterized protein n=1 Tax=Flavobacterium silvaticum TaxID=1852020 RepID=A0A972FKL6_9FLAO|nr:hypothetical protein [Flavobacterium silvaticum]
MSEVRKLYPEAANSKEKADAFHKLLSNVSDSDKDKSLVAYKGCSETLLSKYSGVLSGKIKHMKAGAKLIDAAVAADSDNAEIRMIRLSVQENVPAIVGYKDKIGEDKVFLLANWEKSGALKDYIKNFMLRSKSFTKEEKATLK